MIRTLGNGHAELELRMNALIGFLHEHRAKTAEAFAGLSANIKHIAAAKDIELAKAIAEVEALVGAPEQQQAAE